MYRFYLVFAWPVTSNLQPDSGRLCVRSSFQRQTLLFVSKLTRFTKYESFLSVLTSENSGRDKCNNIDFFLKADGCQNGWVTALLEFLNQSKLFFEDRWCPTIKLCMTNIASSLQLRTPNISCSYLFNFKLKTRMCGNYDLYNITKFKDGKFKKALTGNESQEETPNKY